MRRILIISGAALALPVLAGTASARSLPAPVTVTTNNGGVQVGTGVPGQPLLGASADQGGVCVGFSYEMGTCVPVSTG